MSGNKKQRGRARNVEAAPEIETRVAPNDAVGSVEAGAAKRKPLRFVLVFAGSFAAFEVVYSLWLRSSELFEGYLALNARCSGAILSWLGSSVEAVGRELHGEGAALSVESGCDALQPLALFACGVLAVPSAWRSKLIALALGAPAILMLNLVRITTLFASLRNDGYLFEELHEAVWPMVFVFAALILWASWAGWATRERSEPIASLP